MASDSFHFLSYAALLHFSSPFPPPFWPPISARPLPLPAAGTQPSLRTFASSAPSLLARLGSSYTLTKQSIMIV